MLRMTITKNRFHTVLFCVAAIIIHFAIYNIIHELLTHVHVEQRLAETIGRLCSSICILIFFHKCFDIKNFGITKTFFFKGLLVGGFMFLACLNNLAAAISDDPIVTPSLYLILIVIAEQLSIGIFEEFLFRGLILNTLLYKIPDHSFRNKITAVVISSVLFGIIHFANLFSYPELINYTIAQVFYALFIGVFLGVLYLRTKNIWIVVFYHFLYDLASELPSIFYEAPAETLVDLSVSDALITIAFNSLFLLVGLFLARKLSPRKK